MTPRHFLLVDDHPAARRGIRAILAETWAHARFDELDSGATLPAFLRDHAVDLVTLDLSLPDRHGFECLADIRRSGLDVPVLVLSLHAAGAFALKALELGANGYLRKDRAAEELQEAVRRILGGARHIGPDAAAPCARRAFDESGRALHENLSLREFSVLREIAGGSSVREIAERLRLSPKTVSTYRARILRKLECRTNADLTRYCVDHQLLG